MKTSIFTIRFEKLQLLMTITRKFTESLKLDVNCPITDFKLMIIYAKFVVIMTHSILSLVRIFTSIRDKWYKPQIRTPNSSQ